MHTSQNFFPTIKGRAGELEVNWVVNSEDDIERKNQLEEQFKSSSTLMQLMLRNAYTREGISQEEHDKAKELIMNSDESETDCWQCVEQRKLSKIIKKGVSDTNLCIFHNLQALYTRK